MIDFDKMCLKMSLLVAEGTFTDEQFNDAQAQELHNLVNKIETPLARKINPFKVSALINNAIKNADLFEAKYLEYGGDPKKIKALGEDILKDVKESFPGISTIGQIKRKITGGK